MTQTQKSTCIQQVLFPQQQMTAQDVEDLRMLNQSAPGYQDNYKYMTYYIKSHLLRVYGTFNGVDLQVWKDYIYLRETESKEEWAIHKHILARFALGDYIFHIPTNQFYYSRLGWWEGDDEKKSDNFFYYEKQAVCHIKGKKDNMATGYPEDHGIRMLNRLNQKFHFLFGTLQDPNTYVLP